MAKNTPAPTTTSVPDYIRTDAPRGVDELRKYQSVPRIKTVQALTDNEVKTKFGDGSAILPNDDILVAKYDEEFGMVPLLFYPSWQKWSDINDASVDNPIMDETMDDKSEMARLANQRAVEPYGNGFNAEYRMALNYIVAITTGDAAGVAAVLTFVKGGEGVGRKINGMLNRRAAAGADLFANLLTMKVGQRKNRKGQTWNQIDCESADWVPEDQLSKFGELHAEIAAAFNQGKATVQDDAAT